jgi:integrase
MSRTAKGPSLLDVLAKCVINHLPDAEGMIGNTIVSCKCAFELLFKFFGESEGIEARKVAFSMLDEDRLERFLAWLGSERGCSPSTARQRLAAISSFAKCCARKCPIGASALISAISVIEKPRVSNFKQVRHFTKDELEIPLELPNRKSTQGCRDFAAMPALYPSGARAAELCSLNAGDTGFGNPPANTRITLTGKPNGTVRTVAIPRTPSDVLDSLLPAGAST